MVIQQITIRDFGAVSCYEASFHPGWNILHSRDTPELFAALSFFLCSRALPPIPPGWVCHSTRLAARILLGGQCCSVFSAVCDGQLTIKATDSHGEDITDRYRETLDHCTEQDTAEGFDGRNPTLPFWLYRYRNLRDFDPNHRPAHGTDRITDTKTFRAHLMRYIKAFRPEPIHCRKRYLTRINDQGVFEAYHPDIPHRISLSETEEILFRYLCFLNAAQFWEDIESNRDLHREKKPLIIRNFLEYLDESAQLDRLIQRTLRLQRQVLILTP